MDPVIARIFDELERINGRIVTMRRGQSAHRE